MQAQIYVDSTWTAVRFLNGEDTLNFAPAPLNGSANPYRIGGEFDASGYANANYGLRITITGQYVDGRFETVVDSSHRFAAYSTRRLGYARGWVLAARSQLFYQADGNYTYLGVGEGDGSMRIYGPVSGPANCNGGACKWTSATAGVFDTLIWNKPASIVERHFINGSKWIYNLSMSAVIQYQIGRLGDTTYFGYDAGTLQVDSITDPYRIYNGHHTYTVINYAGPGGAICIHYGA